MIHTGDAIEVMRTLPEASVDAVCTDPPYNLAFMGRAWDEHPSPSKFMAWCTEWAREALRVTVPGGYLLAFGGTRTHHRLVCGLEDAGWIIRDELDWIYASGFPKGKANLKPAHEPIVLARKPGPLRPLAIDACRIGTTFDDPVRGRWPSNVLLSDPELFDVENPEVVGSGAVRSSAAGTQTYRREPTHDPSSYQYGSTGNEWEAEGYGGTGGYSRFFIIPKADRADREPVLRGQLERQPQVPTMGAWPNDPAPAKAGGLMRENAHPTVKPVDLMRHLVRLVTPTGGTVLDPFLGSGSTAIACEMEGFAWLGIEKEAEYVAIAEARLNGVQKGLGLVS